MQTTAVSEASSARIMPRPRLRGKELILEGVIATGGSSTVYKGFLDGIPVAVKRFSEKNCHGTDRRRMHDAIFNEYALMKLVASDSIVAPKGMVFIEGSPAIVMEYLEGPTLSQRLLEPGVIGHDERMEVARMLCGCISAVHSARISYAPSSHLVHRDIKPGNLIMSGHKMKLIDFGSARLFGIPGDPPASGGTIRYMSPEQIIEMLEAQGRCERGVSLVDKRSDIYSAGMILYRLFCGSWPYRLMDDEDDAISSHLNFSIVPPSARHKSLGYMDSFFFRLLSKSPENRIATIEHVEEFLSHVIPTSPILTGPEKTGLSGV